MTIQAIGSDSEMFVADMSGEIVSAIGMIGGTKDEPLWIGNGNLQEDNVLAEFAINPAESEDQFVQYIQETTKHLEKHLSKVNLKPVLRAFAELDAKHLQHPDAQRFGCSPDMSAHTRQINTLPSAEEIGGFRTAGGHIHVSFTEADEWDSAREELIRWMDLFLGAPLTAVDPDVIRRRDLYGKAGAYRAKSYGVEYRALSSIWIQSEYLIRWAYRQVHSAYTMFLREDIPDEDYQIIANYMNTGNGLNEVSELYQKYSVEIPKNG